MDGPPLGSDPEQNLQQLQQAVAVAQAMENRAFNEHAVYQGQMRHLMAHQEPALQTDDAMLELAETADTKRCASCRIVKPVSEYYKDRTHSRGIKTRCKSCLRACKEAFKNQQRAKSASEQVTVTTKKCSHCGEEKSAADFSRSSYQRTGLRSWCKDCSSKSKKQAKAEGRWKSYDSKAKLHQQRIEELIAMQQPRKCRKCDETRQPEEFPPDARQPNRRLKDCMYCIENQEGGFQSVGLNPDGTLPMASLMQHSGWEADPSRALYHQADSYQHQQPANDNLMRILQAAVTGNVHDDGRRSSGDIRNQMGMYPETPETFQELPPDAQAAVLQQIVDHQQRQSILQAQAHQGYGNESIYQREIAHMGYPTGGRQEGHHLMQYQDHHESHHDQSGSASQVEAEAGERSHHFAMGHYDQLRQHPYATQQLVQHQQGLPHHQDWSSAFASVPRHHGGSPHNSSPRRQRGE